MLSLCLPTLYLPDNNLSREMIGLRMVIMLSCSSSFWYASSWLLQVRQPKRLDAFSICCNCCLSTIVMCWYFIQYVSRFSLKAVYVMVCSFKLVPMTASFSIICNHSSFFTMCCVSVAKDSLFESFLLRYLRAVLIKHTG